MADLYTAFLDLHHFIVIQQNGQRIICTKGSENSSTHHEIFLSQLPKDFTETDIIPYLLEFGDIHKIRTMLNFNGQCRGFCYIDFKEKLSSIRACNLLNNIRLGKSIIHCTISDEDCRVIFVSFNWRQTRVLDMIWDILQETDEITGGKTGIEKITVHDHNYHGRVHCFIKFNEHGKAATVRKHLRNVNKILFESTYIDWKKRCYVYNQLPTEILEIYPDPEDVLKIPEMKLINFDKCIDYCDLKIMLV